MPAPRLLSRGGRRDDSARHDKKVGELTRVDSLGCNVADNFASGCKGARIPYHARAG